MFYVQMAITSGMIRITVIKIKVIIKYLIIYKRFISDRYRQQIDTHEIEISGYENNS